MTTRDQKATLVADLRRALEGLDIFLDGCDEAADLIEDEEIGALLADTNAFNWHTDVIEVLGVASAERSIKVTTNVWMVGEQDTDKPPCGETLVARVVFEMTGDGDVETAVMAAVVDDDFRDDDEREKPLERLEFALQSSQ
jgi:hypothetical protein